MEYSTLSARLATFEPPTKRSKSGWPHARPTAEDVAKAGFYHKPQAAGSDNTICYLCERALDGWEADDDPVQEHLKHSPECGWAVLMDIAQKPSYNDTEDPTTAPIADARKATFSVGWPHESKRGWTCKAEKMVEAGWHFAPTEESEDFVSCAFCKLSLDGWEPKDNPFDEHYRRSPDCTFFVFAGSTAPSKRPKAKKGRPSRASRGSKVSSRFSAQSNMSMMSEATSIPDLDESIDTSTTSVMSTMSTASTALNKGKRKAAGGKKATKSKKTKTAKSTKTKKAVPEEEDAEAALEPQQERIPEPAAQEIEPVSTSVHEGGIEHAQVRRSSTVPVPSSSHASPPTNPNAAPEVPKSPIRAKLSPSPASDIENAPPSTRPASVRPPLSSPGEVAPTWRPADVELVFQSASAADIWEVNAELSEQEKSMTVQDWIEHIAGRAEVDLRAEGERVVGVFEKEGARAMGVLESLVCV